MTDVSCVPLGAVPEDVLGVDGANEELEHKLPVARTEQDHAGGVYDIDCFSILATICDIESEPDSVYKCRESKAEGEDGQMPLWVFYEQGSYIGVGQEVDGVKYCA